MHRPHFSFVNSTKTTLKQITLFNKEMWRQNRLFFKTSLTLYKSIQIKSQSYDSLVNTHVNQMTNFQGKQSMHDRELESQRRTKIWKWREVCRTIWRLITPKHRDFSKAFLYHLKANLCDLRFPCQIFTSSEQWLLKQGAAIYHK